MTGLAYLICMVKCLLINMALDYTMNDKYVNQLSSQYNALGISNISDFIQKYKMQDTPLSYFNIGAKYDFSDAYILGEYMQVDTNSFIAD